MAIYAKFNERAQRVLSVAQKEAQAMRHPYVGTEHLLLALVAEARDDVPDLPESMTAELRAMRPEASAASWALRWVQQIPGVTMILSGMSDLAQMQDNLATFDHPQPLSEEETACLLRFAEQMKNAVPCTACRYCCDGCPQRINIPQMLRVLNEIRIAPSTNAIMAVEALPESQQPSACLGCGACAAICPQKIDIPGCMQELTERIAKIPSWAEISRQRAAAQP